MNIKQFLILKACDVLPTDLKYYILDIIQNEAAKCIQRIYNLKIAKNIDIFISFMSIANNLNFYPWHYVNLYIKYAARNITYTYIQEPGTWLEYLEDIYAYYLNSRYFNINNVHYIMNNIKRANDIYRNTGIEYWNNF